MPTREEMIRELQASKNPTREEMIRELQGSASDEMKVLDEASDISPIDRQAVKNFGGSIDDKVSYLKKRNPSLEIQQYNNEIIAKRPDQKEWRKLDPGGMANLNPLEAVQDLADVGYDIGALIASSAAGANAGLLGGAVSGGFGAVPAAAVASGSTSAGLEALRQKIGQYLGTSGDLDTAQIATTGALGAAGPLLFGAGIGGKQIANAVANPQTVSKILSREGLGYVPKGAMATAEQSQVAADILQNYGQGILGKGAKTVGKLMASVPEKAISKGVEEAPIDLISSLSKSGLDIDPNRPHTYQELAIALKKQGGLEGFGEAAAETIFSTIDQKKQQLMDLYRNSLQDKKFEISGLKSSLEKIIDEKKGSKIDVVRSQAERARQILGKYFTPEAQYAGKVFDQSGSIIKDLGKHSGPIFDQAGNQIERRSLRAGKEIYVSGPEAMDINNALSEFIDYTKSPLAISNMSAEDRILRGVVSDAKESLQDKIYSQIDNLPELGDKSLRAEYAKNREFFKNVAKYFDTPEKAVRSLKNMSNDNMDILKNRMQNFDKENQTNISKLADLAFVTKHFGDPSLEPISSGGATSTGRILRGENVGGTIGNLAGILSGTAGASAVGTQVGRSLGSTATGPATTAAAMKGYTALRRGVNKIGGEQLANMVNQAQSKVPYYLQPSMTATGLYQGAVQTNAIPNIWNMIGGQ